MAAPLTVPNKNPRRRERMNSVAVTKSSCLSSLSGNENEPQTQVKPSSQSTVYFVKTH